MKTEADVKVVSAQGTEVVLQGEPTEESESAGVVVEESMGAESQGGSVEKVELESETETEIKSEDDAEGEKDVEVHEQVAELAGVEAIGEGVLEESEEEIEEESDDETETDGDDAEGQNVTEEESR